MKITIEYEFDPTYGQEQAYWAIAKVNGHKFMKCGFSYQDAKEQLLERIKAFYKTAAEPVPPSEEVEL